NTEETWARYTGNPRVAVGHRNPVDQYEADDFAERQRDDGEIVAAQSQHRKAEQDTPEGGKNAGERQQRIEGEAEGLGEQRVRISADGVERDVAEIEQAGEADDDIQPEPEHHIDQDL